MIPCPMLRWLSTWTVHLLAPGVEALARWTAGAFEA